MPGTKFRRYRQLLAVLAGLGPCSMPILAQASGVEPAQGSGEPAGSPDVVDYPASYFSRYRPNSALDMLNQLPGFRLATSGELRGYGTDAGNVLINGRRPSAKRVTVASILDRLLSDVPAAVRWFVTAYRNSDTSHSPSFSNISVSDKWHSIDYNAALDVFRAVNSDRNEEDIVDGSSALTEARFEDGHDREFEANFDLTASRQVGATLFTYSHQIGIQEGSEAFTSQRRPELPGEGPGQEVIDGDSDEFQFELGLTAERYLRPELKGNFLVF